MPKAKLRTGGAFWIQRHKHAKRYRGDPVWQAAREVLIRGRHNVPEGRVSMKPLHAIWEERDRMRHAAAARPRARGPARGAARLGIGKKRRKKKK